MLGPVRIREARDDDWPAIWPFLHGIVTAIDLSRRTLRIIKQNLWWSFTYNFTSVPLAMAGLVTPWMAGVGMAASSLLVVLNVDEGRVAEHAERRDFSRWVRDVFSDAELAAQLAKAERRWSAAEIVDLRSLRPLDEDTVTASVRKTHRCVVVHEGWPYGGVGAEIADRVQRLAFDWLDAPVVRHAERDRSRVVHLDRGGIEGVLGLPDLDRLGGARRARRGGLVRVGSTPGRREGSQQKRGCGVSRALSREWISATFSSFLGIARGDGGVSVAVENTSPSDAVTTAYSASA